MSHNMIRVGDCDYDAFGCVEIAPRVYQALIGGVSVVIKVRESAHEESRLHAKLHKLYPKYIVPLFFVSDAWFMHRGRLYPAKVMAYEPHGDSKAPANVVQDIQDSIGAITGNYDTDWRHKRNTINGKYYDFDCSL